MCDALIYHGVIENKSLKLDFPIIPFKFLNSFLRGYIDGDGYIKDIQNHQTVVFTSTENFCKKSKLLIENLLGINCYISNSHTNNNITKDLTINGRKQCEKFLDWIYEDANLYLERKYLKYQNIKYINNSLVV